MSDEMLIWLEQLSGCMYDFNFTVANIDEMIPFISPTEWRVSLEQVLDSMDDACEIVDQNWKSLPDYLPGRVEFKRLIVQSALEPVINNVHRVYDHLNIEEIPISTIDQLRVVIVTMSELLELILDVVQTPDASIQQMYVQHEDENDDSFQNVLNINVRDMIQLSFNVNSLRQTYYLTLDELEQ